MRSKDQRRKEVQELCKREVESLRNAQEEVADRFVFC
jgi:hypothetical protein